MFVWATLVDPDLDADALLRVALDEGVAFVPGSAFAIDRPGRSALRLSFATASPAELEEAIDRLARAMARQPATPSLLSAPSHAEQRSCPQLVTRQRPATMGPERARAAGDQDA
jgi:hypothetical protein